MSDKPEGAGYLEKSVQDRYSSMKVPALPTRGNHPNMKPVGEMAADPHGYKPCGNIASDPKK